MKTKLAKVGIILSILLGLLLPLICCPLLLALSSRPNVKEDFRDKITNLTFGIGTLALFPLIGLTCGFRITNNPLYLVFPALNMGILLLVLVVGFWDWLTPLTEVVKVAPEDSDTLCRPYIPVVPCKMESSVTTNEEVKV